MSITWGDYEFDGPSRLDSWTAPRRAGVYAIMYKKDAVKKPNSYTIVYFGESENLSERGFPWEHHQAQCWIDKTGSRNNVYIGVHYMPGSTHAERSSVEQALIAKYNPACNR
jgi:hypothetical protein